MRRGEPVQGMRDASKLVQALYYCIPLVLHHLGEDDDFVQLCWHRREHVGTRSLGYAPSGRLTIPDVADEKVIQIDDEGVGTGMGRVEVLIGEELLKGRFLEALTIGER